MTGPSSKKSASPEAAPQWPELITRLLSGEDLTRENTRWAMNQVMTGAAPPIALAGFLVALAAKGETVAELRALADTMIAHAVAVPEPHTREGSPIAAVDIVGTGGDRHNTVNISTMASLVVAGAGIPVAKHGNRAASSASGSADVLEALGVKLDLGARRAAELISEVGITFLFAQQFHPAFRHAAQARLGLGVPTAFNVLGPLTNPLQPRAGAIGVGNLRMAPLLAGVFAERGQSTLVFRSQDGLDEIATTAPVKIWEATEATDGSVVEQVIDFANILGLERATIADLRGGNPKENAEVALRVLGGEIGPIRDAVALNAAAAVVADGRLLGNRTGTLTERFIEAFELTTNTIDAGQAKSLLERWVAASNR